MSSGGVRQPRFKPDSGRARKGTKKSQRQPTPFRNRHPEQHAWGNCSNEVAKDLTQVSGVFFRRRNVFACRGNVNAR